jgi:Electron transfer DM13
MLFKQSKYNHMKNFLFVTVLVSSVLAMACQKNSTVVPVSPPVTENPPSGSGDSLGKLLVKGTFMQGVEGSVAGKAGIYADSLGQWLVLDSFSVTQGPDLHVYLAKELPPLHFIDLGKLKATAGKQVYAINGMPDYASFKYAVVHCQQYNVVFGSAALK